MISLYENNMKTLKIYLKQRKKQKFLNLFKNIFETQKQTDA